MTKRTQDKYNHKRSGIDESVSFRCLVREWPDGLFSVAVLCYGKRDLLPIAWPVRHVTEEQARAVLEREA